MQHFRRIAHAALVALAVAPAARAGVLTETLTVTASGFADLTLGGHAAPSDPASLTFSISFDPSLGDVVDRSSGIVLLSSTVAVDGGLAFGYDRAEDLLTVGGSGLGGVGITEQTNDLLVSIANFSSAAIVEEFTYTSASTFGIFDTLRGTIAVPEPSGLALLAGFAPLLALVRRQGRT